MAGLSDFYRQLEAAGRLPSVYSGNGSMRAQSGDPFVEGFMDGRNIRNSVLAEKEAIEDRERAKQMMDQARNTWYQGDYTRGQIPDSPYPVTQSQMGDNPLGKPLGQVLYEGLSGAQNGAQASPAKTDYSFPARQGAEPMDTTFQNAMPTEKNGYFLGDRPQTEMYGDPQDWQRQMVRNEAGLNGEQKWFNPNGFGSAINKAQNTINQNFQNPSSDNTAALAGEGTGVSANDLTRPQTLDKYLGRRFNTPQFGADYGLQQWMRDDRAHGVTDPFVSLLRYQMFIDPIVQQARQDDLRNAFAIYNNPNATPEERNNAIAKMEFYLKRPGLNSDLQRREDEYYAKRGMMRNPNFGVGGNILSSLGDFKEGEQWMSPDGTGNSRTQCSNFVSHVLNRAGIKGLGSANGDELMRQFGNAYHEGLEGIQPGDVLNFKDHVGFYVGNGQYVARNSSGGVHQGSMEEAIQAFGQPLGYGSVSEYTGSNRKYIQDPNFVSPRERFNTEQAYRERLLGLRENAINNRSARLSSNVNPNLSGLVDKKGRLTLPYDVDSTVDEAIESLGNGFKTIEENGNGDLSGQVNSLANSLSPVYKYLTENGMGEQQAKSTISNLLDEKMNKFDKELTGKLGAKRKRDIIERVVTGQKDELQKRHTRHYSEENKSAGKTNGRIPSPRNRVNQTQGETENNPTTKQEDDRYKYAYLRNAWGRALENFNRGRQIQ